jgi:hypothetical protein
VAQQTDFGLIHRRDLVRSDSVSGGGSYERISLQLPLAILFTMMTGEMMQ